MLFYLCTLFRHLGDGLENIQIFPRKIDETFLHLMAFHLTARFAGMTDTHLARDRCTLVWIWALQIHSCTFSVGSLLSLISNLVPLLGPENGCFPCLFPAGRLFLFPWVFPPCRSSFPNHVHASILCLNASDGHHILWLSDCLTGCTIHFPMEAHLAEYYHKPAPQVKSFSSFRLHILLFSLPTSPTIFTASSRELDEMEILNNYLLDWRSMELIIAF